MRRPVGWETPSSHDESASLETDVMRFMAILGFCVMILFARAAEQSLPAPETAPTASPQSTTPQPTTPAVTTEPTSTVTSTAPPATPAAQWTLQVASDQALLTLLRHQLIGLYVQRADHHLQVLADGRLQPAAGQLTLYPMAAPTVPDPLRRLAERAGADTGHWAVTLSGSLQQAIAQARQRHAPGRLLIQADASVHYAGPGG